MQIFIGADHRGYQLKEAMRADLQSRGFEVEDQGAFEEGVACDYPDIALKVARAVSGQDGARGILVCWTGIGHSIAANKVPGAYAALCYNREAAILSREHNDCNILVLGAKFVDAKDIPDIIQVWLNTPFSGGRHLRRVEKIKQIEREALGGGNP